MLIAGVVSLIGRPINQFLIGQLKMSTVLASSVSILILLGLLITLFSLTITFGQDQITWNEVGVVAKEGYANNIIQTMDNFYGNIEMEEVIL